ncbi:MAG: ATP-dependent protease ATPase subunit HslU [Deltaproteobacteria bacterium]|jgi:ATP-dependent HslUV protease ATP-binding subunit HslU|nr:ATP-dependent protease ATPase subunit HslU [Deltaproteobacteria bacterium]
MTTNTPAEPNSSPKPINQDLNLTPKEIVKELDRYIIGQHEAKRAVAIALRNRYRRLLAHPDMRDEIAPKNIIMIGPTGVGKTEIARRLARLARSPFIKVEASKYTEVGYVGRDVESMIRELMDLAVNMVMNEEKEKMSPRAVELAEERILDLLLPGYNKTERAKNLTEGPHSGPTTRGKLRRLLKEKRLEEREIPLEVEQSTQQPMTRIFTNMGLDEMEKNLNDAMSQLFPRKSHKRMVKVREAREILIQEEANRLVDFDKVVTEAKNRVEQHGLIFIDEIDKVAGHENRHGPDVSREGVQRDLLPLVEGSTVPTKHGPIKTDHILFIAAGAFHVSKPSDLIPELQGRFPIRVELTSLTKDDFVKILKEPRNALITQYQALLDTEEIYLEFTDEAVEELASMAFLVNDKQENIGARRLATIMEKLLDQISFDAPEISPTKIVITREYVQERLASVVGDTDLTRYIL